MRAKQPISVFLQFSEPPYMIHGMYMGTHKFNERNYLIVEGTVGDHIGYDIYIPEDTITRIETRSQP
jgi:hypothetical protein